MPFTRSVVGGSFHSAALLAKGLIEHEIEVLAVFPNDGPSVKVFRQYEIPVSICDFPFIQPVQRHPKGVLQYVWNNKRTFHSARDFLLEQNANLIHCNDDTSIISWGVAARSVGVKCTWHVRKSRPGMSDAVRLRLAKKVICISNFVATRFPSHVNPAVIYNPVDACRFRPSKDKKADRASLGLPLSEVQFIQIGRDVPYKNSDWTVFTLSVALDAGWDCRALFLGRFSEERQHELLSLLRPMDRHRVSFLGWTDRPEYYLAASDLLLHPAIDEPFGRVLIEAAACRVPFIGTNTGAVPELLAAGLPGRAALELTMESFAESACEFLFKMGKESSFCSNLLNQLSCSPFEHAQNFIRVVSES